MKRVRNVCRTLCILTLILALTNCQNDTVTEMQQEASTQKEFPFTSSLISKQEVEANTKLSTQMRSLTTLQNSSMAESTYTETYNFTVHTNAVKFIESTENNSHSYTFPISRENNTGTALENLVFSYNTTTDDYEASLVTYHFNAAQQQEFLLTQHVATPHEITSMPIAVNLSDVVGENLLQPCTTNFTVYHITPDTGETFLYSSTIGNVQNTCQHENDDDPCQTYTQITYDCPDGGSTSGSGTNDNTSTYPYGSSNNTTSGGGNNTSSGTTTSTNFDNNNDNIVTSPITRLEIQELTSQLNTVLNGNDTWEFNSEINPDNAIYFDSVEEFEAMLEAESFESANEDNYEDQDGNTHSTIKVKLGLFATLRIDIGQKLRNSSTNQAYQVESIETNYSGITIGSEWEQNDFSPNDVSVNNGFATIDVKGNLEFLVFFEGIGGIAADFKHYRFVINIDTGEIVSMQILD